MFIFDHLHTAHVVKGEYAIGGIYVIQAALHPLFAILRHSDAIFYLLMGGYSEYMLHSVPIWGNIRRGAGEE
jgi:hypothetical protein